MFFCTTTFWQYVLQWDQYAFEKINSGLANPVFDELMPFLRNSLNWAPLYLFLLVFVLMNYRIKGLWWVVMFLVTVALTDMTGTYVFKHGFERLRPCSDPGFLDHVRLVVKECSRGFSFISNHAANHFGMAAFFFVTFRHRFPKWAWVALLWAGVISFAQVYVGVHYPGDILCGALLGLAFGISTGTFFNKQSGFAIFGNQPAA
jgi:undecaprenyl-diphosphatase